MRGPARCPIPAEECPSTATPGRLLIKTGISSKIFGNLQLCNRFQGVKRPPGAADQRGTVEPNPPASVQGGVASPVLAVLAEVIGGA